MRPRMPTEAEQIAEARKAARLRIIYHRRLAQAFRDGRCPKCHAPREQFEREHAIVRGCPYGHRFTYARGL